MKNKILLAGLIASLATFPAFAQSNTTGTGTGTAQAGASGGNVTFAPVNGGSSVDYAAATAIAPGLTAGLKTCMGSSSSGIQGMHFGVAFGSTWHDEDCQAGEFGQQLWNQGYKAAAIGVLCSRDVIRYAIAVTGGIPYRRNDGAIVHRACPMTQDEWKKAGQPLLDPISGQPYSDAELNPPVQTQPVANVQSNAVQMEAAKAAIIEQHAKEAQQAAAQNIAQK